MTPFDSWFVLQERYCNIGWSMVSSDVNNDEAVDLLIGAPFAPAGGEQRGFIGTFYSKKGYQGT